MTAGAITALSLTSLGSSLVGLLLIGGARLVSFVLCVLNTIIS